MTELKPAPVIKVALRDNQNTQQQSKEEAHQAKTAGLNEVVVTSNPKFKNRQEAREATKTLKTMMVEGNIRDKYIAEAFGVSKSDLKNLSPNRYEFGNFAKGLIIFDSIAQLLEGDVLELLLNHVLLKIGNNERKDILSRANQNGVKYKNFKALVEDVNVKMNEINFDIVKNKALFDSKKATMSDDEYKAYVGAAIKKIVKSHVLGNEKTKGNTENTLPAQKTME